MFCESEYWDTFGGFLKNYLFLRSLFPLPLPLNVIGDPYRPYFAMCACAKAESWEEIEAMRSRGAAERPNTAACELSENGEFRRWIYLIFFNLFWGGGRKCSVLVRDFHLGVWLKSLWVPPNSLWYMRVLPGITPNYWVVRMKMDRDTHPLYLSYRL